MVDCVFCKIIKGEIPSEKIYEDAAAIAFLDIAPVHPGHALVVAKTHHETLSETPDELACYLMSIVKKIMPAILKSTDAQGINVGINNGLAAGQVVPHIHYHVIPRFSNDGLKFWPQQKYQEGQIKNIGARIRTLLL